MGRRQVFEKYLKHVGEMPLFLQDLALPPFSCDVLK
jgi:hypothetical protein